MARFEMDVAEFNRLQQAMKNYQGDTEQAINDVLHNEGSQLIQEGIYRFMPVSGKTWRGKKPAAKSSKSLTDETSNLTVIIKSAKAYQYLYFPDDGTNTRRHVGDQQFFIRGTEAKQSSVIDLCVNRLINEFENL